MLNNWEILILTSSTNNPFLDRSKEEVPVHDIPSVKKEEPIQTEGSSAKSKIEEMRSYYQKKFGVQNTSTPTASNYPSVTRGSPSRGILTKTPGSIEKNARSGAGYRLSVRILLLWGEDNWLWFLHNS